MIEFKEIPNYENYEISKCGIVRKNGEILKQRLDKDKRPRINLSKKGVKTTFNINQLVNKTFLSTH